MVPAAATENRCLLPSHFGCSVLGTRKASGPSLPGASEKAQGLQPVPRRPLPGKAPLDLSSTGEAEGRVTWLATSAPLCGWTDSWELGVGC